jgi:hypothetical protein
MDSANILVTLLLCGLMGLIGQGVRAVVGLKKSAEKEATLPTAESTFNASYLFVSLMIGFIAGIIGGIGIGLSNLTNIDPTNVKVLLGIAAVGYSGTDFIESAFKNVIPGLPSARSIDGQLIDTIAARPNGIEPAKTMAFATHLVGSGQTIVSADDVIGQLNDPAAGSALTPNPGDHSPRSGAGVQPGGDSRTGAAADSNSNDVSNSGSTPLKDTQDKSSQINGFDCYSYPGDDRVAWLRGAGQFRVSVCYLAHAPKKKDSSWIDKRGYLAAGGWGFLPTYVGLQIGSDSASASAGTAHGLEAIGLMKEAGFALNSIVYLDLEDGTEPSGSYEAYIRAWIASVAAEGFSPGIYCSHILVGWARKLTQFVWSFHVPRHTEGDTYDPGNLPTASIDDGCIATQYRQNVNLKGLQIPGVVDSGGIDLNLCAVADPSNLASVSHALAT